MPVRPWIGLLRACHPGPTVVVTAFAAAWSAVAVRLPGPTVLLVAGAVLLGQLSIGWSNDWIDAARDSAAARADKPLSAGTVTRRAVATAAVVSAVGCAIASLALGLLPGVVHVIAVAAGWTYNAVAKYTVASPLPFVVAFGLLPAVATLAGDRPALPEPGVLVAGAALGVAAHFANTVGDVVADAATGVRGLPQRVGPAASMAVTAAFVSVAGLALLVGTSRPGAVGTGVLAAGVAVSLAGLVVRGHRAFRVTLVAVALVIVGLLLGG